MCVLMYVVEVTALLLVLVLAYVLACVSAQLKGGVLGMVSPLMLAESKAQLWSAAESLAPPSAQLSGSVRAPLSVIGFEASSVQ